MHLLFPLCPPSRQRGGPLGPRLPAALLCGPGLCISLLRASFWPPFPSRHSHWKTVFQIAAVNCTCLADYLWESVGGAERENVAWLCRSKTLSHNTRLLPRVTKSSAGRDSAPDDSGDDSVGERGRSNPAFRGLPTPRVEPRVLPAPPVLPAEVPTRCFQGGRTVIKSARLQCNGNSPGRQRGDRTPGTRHRN